MMKKFLKTLTAVALPVMMIGSMAHAAGGETKPLKHPHFAFEGVTGSYDQDALQRGFQVYREVCAACHSLNYVAFRHLGDPGGPYYMDECPVGVPEGVDCSNPNNNPIIKALAAEYMIEDGPDDAGDMFMRPGLPSDFFPAPFANPQQAMAANGGALPPDMSLIAKARHHGPQYVYSLMLGYEEPPATITVPAGTYYNVYYPGDTTSLLQDEYLDENGYPLEGVDVPYGGAFKMAPPLRDGIVTYADGSDETVEQYAYDVASFLMWAAEPKMEQRKKMGMVVFIYLFILAIIVYLSYKQLWKNVKDTD